MKADKKFPRLHPLVYTAILLLLSPFLISSIGLAIRFWTPSEEALCATSNYQGLYMRTICDNKRLAGLRRKMEELLTPNEIGHFDMSAVRVCAGSYNSNRPLSPPPIQYSASVRNCLEELMKGAIHESLLNSADWTSFEQAFTTAQADCNKRIICRMLDISWKGN